MGTPLYRLKTWVNTRTHIVNQHCGLIDCQLCRNCWSRACLLRGARFSPRGSRESSASRLSSRLKEKWRNCTQVSFRSFFAGVRHTEESTKGLVTIYSEQVYSFERKLVYDTRKQVIQLLEITILYTITLTIPSSKCVQKKKRRSKFQNNDNAS